jgi:hypothetical protein
LSIVTDWPRRRYRFSHRSFQGGTYMATYLGLLTIMAGVYLLLHGAYSYAHQRAVGAAASIWSGTRLSNRRLRSLMFGAGCLLGGAYLII